MADTNLPLRNSMLHMNTGPYYMNALFPFVFR